MPDHSKLELARRTAGGMIMRRRTALLLILCSFFSITQASATEKLEPADTYAVISGVLKWPNNALTPFSSFNRKDQELYDTLQKLGVPAENMALLLDEQATHAGLSAALEKIAQKAKAGSTLLFYYAGHGDLKGGKISLCNYDCAGPKGTGKPLGVDEIGALLARSFKGKQVILMADCCYSGGLKQTAEALHRAGIAAVSLTSASASNTSTLNWTFTQTVLDTLHGETLADTDGDGFITLRELADEVCRAMKFREKQFYGYANFGVKDTLRLGKVDPDKKRPDFGKDLFTPGQYILGMDGDRPRAGRVLGKNQNKYIVEYYDYSVKRLVQLPAAGLKPIQFWTFPAGKETLVFWGDKTWKAKILKIDGDFHFITYPGWDSSWDEWVLCDRVVDPALAHLPKVQVEWKGSFYPAQILKLDNGEHYVRYFGYDADWNEWVGKSRIKFPAEK
jgi:hypothetical protein